MNVVLKGVFWVTLLLAVCLGEAHAQIELNAETIRQNHLEHCNVHNNPEACARLGLEMLLEAEEGTAEPITVLGYLEKACAGISSTPGSRTSESCLVLANIYVTGWEGRVGRNEIRARELYIKGCDNENYSACGGLAFTYYKGQGGPKDVSKALQSFERACGGGHQNSCNNLQVLRQNLCKSGDQSACQSLKNAEKDAEKNASPEAVEQREKRAEDESKLFLYQFQNKEPVKAANTEDCKSHKGCAMLARCSLVSGACTVGSAADCKASELCRVYGLCGFKDGQCIALTDDECRKSDACKRIGTCTACPSPKWAEACRTQGICGCAYGKGTCGATSDADCRGSDACLSQGRCVSSSRSGAVCIAESSADCRASEGCRSQGRCVLEGEFGECAAGSTEDCRRSEECRTRGHCEFMREQDMAFCGPTAADCRASEECASKGVCELGKTPGGFSACVKP